MGDQTFRFTLTIEIDAPSREEAEETAQKLVKLSPAMASSLNGNAYRFVDVSCVKPTPEQVAEAGIVTRSALESARTDLRNSYERGEAPSGHTVRTLLAVTTPRVRVDMVAITRASEDAYHNGPQGRRHEGERKLLATNAVVDAVLAMVGKVRVK